MKTYDEAIGDIKAWIKGATDRENMNQCVMWSVIFVIFAVLIGAIVFFALKFKKMHDMYDYDYDFDDDMMDYEDEEDGNIEESI